MSLDGFIGPGHVATVVGTRPFEFIPAEYGRPIAISGFEPLDVLQSILMVLRQLRDGRAEVENQYRRVVPAEGNPRALEVMAEVFELRPTFEWRGLGFIPHSALRLSDAYARVRRRGALQRPGRAHRRPQGLPVRRGPQGRDQAVGVQGVRHRVHARARDRDLHGLARGGLRRLLQLRPRGAHEGGRLSPPSERLAGGREQRVLEIIETARAKRARFRDERITLAHGAGGKATQTLIEGLLAPGVRRARRHARGARRRRRRRARGHASGDDDRQLRRQAAALPGRLDRRAGGQRHRQRPRGLGGPAARADRLADPRGGARLRGAASRDRRRSPPPRPRRASRSSPATPRWSSAAPPTGCTSARPGSGALDPRGRLSSTAIAAGDRILLSGPIAEHGTAIMLARNQFELDASIESDTCSLWPAVDALLEAAGFDLHCMRDATRGGVASALNELARAAGVSISVREARRSRGGGRRRGRRAARDRPDVRGQRGAGSSRSSRRRRRRRRSRRCVACRAARRRR